VPRYALLLAYDGTGFAGWWRQPDQRTVAGELDVACARVGEDGAQAVGSSRTDAGVHACGQLAHVDLRRSWQPGRLAAALGRHLPPDVSCLAAAAVAPDWHAVHGVRRKTYRYRIDDGPAPDPFLARTAWRVPGHLDRELLTAAALPVPGKRDWAAFVRRGDHREDTVRRLRSCRWQHRDGALACDITADGFILHLARSLVGGMVAVARGAVGASDWEAALAGTPTEAARQMAPAHGLCLWKIVHGAPPSWIPPSA
jgi:tRNA pseudouridine38-40 synthase